MAIFVEGFIINSYRLTHQASQFTFSLLSFFDCFLQRNISESHHKISPTQFSELFLKFFQYFFEKTGMMIYNQPLEVIGRDYGFTKRRQSIELSLFNKGLIKQIKVLKGKSIFKTIRKLMLL
jgi:hypothetical protein